MGEVYKGPASVADLAIPDGLDLEVLEKARTASGYTAADISTLFIRGLAGLNNELAGTGVGRLGTIMSWLSHPATTRQIDKGFGDTSSQENAEFVRGEPVRPKATSWMIGSKLFEQVIAQSWQFMERASRERVEAAIRLPFRQIKDDVRTSFLRRALISADVTVGGSGKSVGIIGGSTYLSGEGYFPEMYEGKRFETTHDHRIVKPATAAGFRAAMEEGYDHLIEHGHAPTSDRPLLLLYNTGDHRTYLNADEEWMTLQEVAVNPGDTERAEIAGSLRPTGATGLIADITAYAIPFNGIPTGRMMLAKTYGPNAPENVFAAYKEPLHNQQAFMLYQGSGTNPRDVVSTMGVGFDFGVGVDNLEAAVLIYLDDTAYGEGPGTWADPTASSII